MILVRECWTGPARSGASPQGEGGSVPDVSARVARWFGAVVDLLAEPHFVMPVAQIAQHLRQVFDLNVVSWNWRDSLTEFGLELDPPEMRQREPEMWKVWETGQLNDCHALMTWHTVTNDVTPHTLARVPTLIVPKRNRLIVEQPLARLESEQQMTLNYRLEGLSHRAFVLCRNRRDFSDDDLEVARLVQRTLMSLDRQVQTLERLAKPPAASAAIEVGLTGRELTVLHLVADGHSSRQVARRLSCSPRTVDKHLERTYRKLGVTDRVNAIHAARLAGILPVVPLSLRGQERPLALRPAEEPSEGLESEVAS
jgi:DNA-binding CsgD family transcriptional regulator